MMKRAFGFVNVSVYNYGIGGNTRTWINSFLTDREQVVVDNATSDKASVTSGQHIKYPSIRLLLRPLSSKR